jgi:hypothetical protein
MVISLIASSFIGIMQVPAAGGLPAADVGDGDGHHLIVHRPVLRHEGALAIGAG